MLYIVLKFFMYKELKHELEKQNNDDNTGKKCIFW